MKYTTVLFDADETLFDFSACERGAICEALLHSGIDATDVVIAAYSEINDSLWKMLERGEIEREKLFYYRFELLAERFGFTLDARATAEIYLLSLSRKSYLIDGAKELISSLDGKVRKYIVTNGFERVQRPRYEASELYLKFDGIFISETMGANKPDLAFFERVAENIEDFDKSKTLIVGDSLSSDILGGINFGIDTCWYTRTSCSTELAPTYVASSLDDVKKIILGG